MNVASNTTHRRSHPRRKHPSTNNHLFKPLASTVICLSGQTPSVKTHLESLISKLGGVSVRDFDPAYVTHLILDEAKGSKYEYVQRNKEKDWVKRLCVIKSTWVLDCDLEGRRIDESLYGLDYVDESQNDVNQERDGVLPQEIQNASLEEACDWMLEQSFPRMFWARNFLMVGFENHDNNDSQGDEMMQLKVMQKLSKLIRRAGGTVYWSPSDVINVVVLSDACSEVQWEDVRSFCQNHPRGPMTVTPDWVLSSLHHKCIKAISFPPLPKKGGVPQPTATKSTNNTDSRPIQHASKKTMLQSNIFYGDIFAIIRPKPHENTISFEKSEIESLITNNGGLLLSKQLSEAIKIDLQSASKNNSTISRNFYVVSSGGYGDNTNLNPLLAEMSQLGVKIIPVNSVWIRACTGDGVQYNASECPLLFQPQAWPIRLLPPKQFLFSCTGFIDASRYGIMWMLKEIGGEYTDNLKSKNTHLICKDATGKKYEKACEWGLHVVSIDWLYHVIRYGYVEGCELDFSFVKGKKKDVPLLPASCSKFPTSKVCELKEPVNELVDRVDNCLDLELLSTKKDQVQETGETSKLPHSVDQHQQSSSPSLCKHKEGNEHSAQDDESPNDVNKRLHSALQSLETSTRKKTFTRRSKRQRQPVKTPEKSPLLLTQPSPQSEEENQQTQYTVAICADAALIPSSYHSIPQSQVDDAEANGESQVIWYANKSGI